MSETPAHHDVGNPLTTLRELMRLEQEVAYIVESLADDLTGEAKRSIWTLTAQLMQWPLPHHVLTQVGEDLAIAERAMAMGERDIDMASRKTQTIRRRLANEIALRIGNELPFSAQHYPTYSPRADDTAAQTGGSHDH